MAYWYFFCILSLFYPLDIQLHQAYTHTLKTLSCKPSTGISSSCDTSSQALWKSYILLAGHWITNLEICLLVILQSSFNVEDKPFCKSVFMWDIKQAP